MKNNKNKANEKKSKLKNKKVLLLTGQIILASAILIFGINFVFKPKNLAQTENVAISGVESQIMADGTIASQNEARLNFQTPGKLVYLPFKEGDKVFAGQTIANLDVYVLQRQLTAALNNYRSTRDTFDQTSDNANSGVLQGQQKYNLEVPNRAGISGQSEVNIINDMVKRIVDQNQANLDNSVVQVELANYALQLSSLQSPVNGVITHEDVNVANLNITPATTFVVSDPNSIIFRSQVKEQDIDFVSTGSEATININGDDSKTIKGTIVQIHPEKITLPNGQNVYKVDIAADELKSGYAFGQSGFVQIKSNISKTSRLVPVWTVLGNQLVWVLENGKYVLKTVVVGKTHGSQVEIISGLSDEDKVVVNPESVISKSYTIL